MALLTRRRELLTAAPLMPVLAASPVVNKIPAANVLAQGASAGTPGSFPAGWASQDIFSGASRTISGVGQVVNGRPAITVRFNGTTTGQFGNVLFTNGNSVFQIPSAIGSVWTLSCYIALIAGTFTNMQGVGLVVWDAIGNGTFSSSSITGGLLTSYTATPTRVSLTGTITAAIARYALPSVYYASTVGAGQVVDMTIQISGIQLQVGRILRPWQM